MGRALNATKSREDPLIDYGSQPDEIRQADKMENPSNGQENLDSNPSKIPVFKSGGTSVNRQNWRGSKKNFPLVLRRRPGSKITMKRYSGTPPASRRAKVRASTYSYQVQNLRGRESTREPKRRRVFRGCNHHEIPVPSYPEYPDTRV